MKKRKGAVELGERKEVTPNGSFQQDENPVETLKAACVHSH